MREEGLSQSWEALKMLSQPHMTVRPLPVV